MGKVSCTMYFTASQYYTRPLYTNSFFFFNYCLQLPLAKKKVDSVVLTELDDFIPGIPGMAGRFRENGITSSVKGERAMNGNHIN